MKRTVTFILTLILLLGFSMNVFAASQGELSLSDVSGKPGETVNVAITVKDNPGIVAMRLHVSYDSSSVSLVEVTDGELLGKGNSTFCKDMSSDPYTLLWEDALATENYTQNGTLAVLKFRILNSASSGKVDVKLAADTSSTFDKDLSEVAFSVSDGSITINGGSSASATETVNNQTAVHTTEWSALPDCDHAEKEWVTVKEPTCTAEGKRKWVCSECDIVLRVESQPLAEHQLSDWNTVAAATDASNGIESRECNACGYEETREIAKDGTVLLVKNNADDISLQSKETNAFDSSESSDYCSETAKDGSVNGSNNLNTATKTITAVLAVVIILSTAAALTIILKKKEENG